MVQRSLDTYLFNMLYDVLLIRNAGLLSNMVIRRMFAVIENPVNSILFGGQNSEYLCYLLYRKKEQCKSVGQPLSCLVIFL